MASAVLLRPLSYMLFETQLADPDIFLTSAWGSVRRWRGLCNWLLQYYRPLSTDFGADQPVKARFWPQLEPSSARKLLDQFRCFLLYSREVVIVDGAGAKTSTSTNLASFQGPHTLQPTPNNPPPRPQTLHPTPRTLHPAPYTLHRTA
jgi:hypothetical protein